MSPLSLIVGILVTASSTLADVKHVLEGSAQPPEPNSINPQAVNYLASGSPNGDYWWMDSNSPLKAAYDYYKKCNTKGTCVTPARPDAPPPQPFLPQATVNINVNKNPFLSGSFNPDAGTASFNKEPPKVDISKNPFLTGSVVTTGNGVPVVKDQEGFLGVQPSQPFGNKKPSCDTPHHLEEKKKPGFATAHPLEEKKKPGFATTHPLEEKKKLLGSNRKNGLLDIKVECRGAGFACVEKEECVDGVVNTNGQGIVQARSDVHYCYEDKEVCCQLNNLNEITAGKSSVPESTIKFQGGAGFSPGLIHVQPLDVKPDIVFGAEHGHHGSSTSKSIRDTSLSPNSLFSSTVDYSNTRFDDDVRFASSDFQGPAYLPPVSPTSPKPFETRQPGINQQFVPSRPSTPYVPPTQRPTPPTFRPSFPSTPRPAPSSNRDYLPPKPSTPSGVTQYVPSRPAPYQPSVTPQKPYQPSGTTQRPYQPSGTTQRPYQPSVTPQQPYQPSVTPQRPYQPSVTPQKPYQPSGTTQRPYQPSVTPQQPYQPSVTPQRPYQPSVTPQKPYQPSVTPQQPYQPSVTPQKPYQPSGTTQRPYQPSITPQQPYQPSVTPQRPYQPSVTPQKPYQPSVTPQQPYQPSVTPQKPYQPSGTTQRPYQPSITPQQPYQPSVTPQRPYQPSVTPQKPYQPSVTPQQPYQPSVTPQRPYQPSVTPQKPYQPSGTTQRPYQPSVTPQRPYQPSVTPQKPYQPSVTPQQPYQPSVTPQRPYQPSVTPQKPYQPSVTPQQPYQPSVTPQKPYQPSVTTQRPYQPSVTPQQPYQPSVTPQKPYQPSFTPQQPYQPSGTTQRPYQPSTSRPTTSREYLPPRPSTPFVPQPSSPRPTPFIPQQTTPRPQFPSPTPQVTNGYPSPSSPRPNPFIPQQPSNPPSSLRPYEPSTQRPAPNPPGGYEYPKPTPTFGYPSTTPRLDNSNSNINNQFVRPPPKKPDNPDQYHEGSNIDGSFIRPTTPRTPFQGELNTAPPPGCAAALKCVQEIYCTAEGVVSPVPVVLTKEQELAKVPTTECQDTESGIIGRCCRDPNYKDPWPSANLLNGVDDGQYKEDDSIAQYQRDLQRNVRSDKGGPRIDFSNNVPQATCGERHLNGKPQGPGPLDVNFAEIPWQAMVLRDQNRSLLCGGVIIRRNAVLTAAHCIEGLETSDILIKGGEWKLGIDEEPLPFQIVNVAAVVPHPQYQKGSLINDLALLILEEKLRPSKNIGTLCMPPENQIPTKNCIATGWGKRILQLHAKGAIMHAIDVKIMDNQQCQETLNSKFQHASTNYSPNTLCGYSDKDQCRVDYGSALACSDGNQYTLSGIYAWDTGCKQEGQIGGYIAPDVEWIESTLSKPLSELRKIQRN